jgi:hypothetical protein
MGAEVTLHRFVRAYGNLGLDTRALDFTLEMPLIWSIEERIQQRDTVLLGHRRRACIAPCIVRQAFAPACRYPAACKFCALGLCFALESEARARAKAAA